MNIGTVLPWFPSSYIPAKNSFAFFTYREMKRLVERGNKIVVITVQRAGMPAFEAMDGILIYRFPSYMVPRIRYDIPNFVKLTNLIKNTAIEQKLDLIEFAFTDFLTSVPAIYIKKKINLPITALVNGLPGISWFTGNRTVDSIGWIYTNLIGKRVIKSVDGLRLLQSPLCDDLSRFGIDKNKMSVLPYGVDTSLFHPDYNDIEVRNELGLTKEDILVLWVGRLVKPVEMKGTKYLIEAIKELLPSYKNLKLVLVGDGNGRKINEYWTKDIKDNVRFTGYRSDVYRFMSAADIFVLPSLCEGLPNVILEAGACGTPVIATRVGGVPDAIGNGETGIIVAPKSVNEIRQALMRLIEDPVFRRRTGEKARERMIKYFAMDVMCQKVEQFYRSVINGIMIQKT